MTIGRDRQRNLHVAAWLADALGELARVEEEALEEGYPEPSASAKTHARRILRGLAGGSLPCPAAYPTEDGEIGIMFQRRDVPAAVLVLCDASGGAMCLSSIAGENRRARYDRASAVPDAFVRAELSRMTSV